MDACGDCGEEGDETMKAVVLVGGEGTRMRPLTETIPKPLLPLMGRAFLHHVLDHLTTHGVHEVILSSPYLASTFEPFIAERVGDPAITWITEQEPLGTGGAVLHALDIVGEEPFFVCNGDILTDLDLTAMQEAHLARGAIASISTFHVEDARPFGLIMTDADGRITEFREKPEESIPGDVNAGTYLLDPSVLHEFPRGVATSIEREIFPPLIASGVPFVAYGSDCYWMDLGTPEKYLRAHFDILEGRVTSEPDFPSPAIAETADISLKAQLGRWVVVSQDVQIAEDAEIEDSVLLAGAVVARGAKVRSSVIGPKARVGEGAELTWTVVGEGAEVPPGARLVDDRISKGDPPPNH